VEARLEAALVPLDLSLAKFSVLRHLAQAGEALALGTLAQRSACVRSNMTQLADRLELDGLVRRIDDPADRRSVKAVLTPEGRIRFRAASAALAEQERRMTEAFGEADRAALSSLLQRLAGTTRRD
jgi:DNA-binding MarR family transcriptional regulator